MMDKHALFVGISWISMVAALAFAAVTIITKSGAFGVASLVAMLCWIGSLWNPIRDRQTQS